MGKLMVSKLIVAVRFAVIAPFVVVALIAGLAKDIQLAGGAATSFSTLLNSEGMAVALIVMAILAFIISFVSAQLVPARRRRQRSSGTMVESDVEDGRERGVVKWFNVKKGFWLYYLGRRRGCVCSLPLYPWSGASLPDRRSAR